MFREMMRFKQQLSQEECVTVLKEEPRGVLSVLGDDDYPYGMPINQYYCEEDGRLYFHSGMKGHKIDAMKRHDKASFCVYDSGFRREGEWALNIKSVIVFGRIHKVQDEEERIDALTTLTEALAGHVDEGSKHAEVASCKMRDNVEMLALVPEYVSGKRASNAILAHHG